MTYKLTYNNKNIFNSVGNKEAVSEIQEVFKSIGINININRISKANK